MESLTLLYLTLNLVPPAWVAYQTSLLPRLPVVSLSRVPMDFGLNVLQDAPPGLENLQRQMLRGATLAETTYVAIVEDDTLYPPDHFRLRPTTDDAFGYNMTLWGLLTWGEPTYYWRNRMLNSTLIAPRALLIEALEERFAAYPAGIPESWIGEVGRPGIEKRLGVTPRKAELLWSLDPVVQFAHAHAHDALSRSHRKRRSAIRAFDIPYWGRADALVQRFA